MSQGDDFETLLLFLLFTGALLQKLWVGGGDSGVVAHVILESALGPISIYAILQLHMTVLQLHKLVYFQLGITHIKVNTYGYLWVFMASK